MFKRSKDRSSEIKELIANSYQCFESGSFAEAKTILGKAHSMDFENPEIRSALRACGFWQQKNLELQELEGHGLRGSYLRSQWARYTGSYRKGFEHPLDDGSEQLKKWVHTLALDYFRKQSDTLPDSEAGLQSARCLKILGRYEESLEAAEEAVRQSGGGDDPRFFAELADIYALVGEDRPAKVLMREALFLGASRVEPEEFMAPLFCRMLDRLAGERDRDGIDFKEWLPVYGMLWGILDVSRELSPAEFAKLKQDIYALNSEIADGDRHGILTPRLINHYFRLIDYYKSAGTDQTAVEEVLMNIRLLSPGIYTTYFEQY